MQHIKTRHLKLVFLCCIFLGIFTTGCNLEISRNDFSESQHFSNNYEYDPVIKNVIVKVNINLTSPLKKDESLFIELVDEISGLKNNPKRVGLFQVNETSYQGEIEAINDAEIKYRYVKYNNEIGNYEVTGLGTPVRYRIFRVSQDAIINDLIAGWSDESFEGPYGRIAGSVMNSETYEKIPDILVTIAGYQTFTDMSGKFVFDGIPPGIHNLVAYSIDGSFLSFQQGVNVLEDLFTQVDFKMIPLPEVQVNFIVNVPNDAVGAPIRFSGNYYHLGNTFADLHEGSNSIASRMPLLMKMEDGRYGISMKLHAGNYIEYRYTLGDGFVNAERDLDGLYVTRKLIIPNHEITIEDQIITWRVEKAEPISIKINAPEDTPNDESISIQLLTNNWTSPIPMWPLGDNNWLYLLYAPQKSGIEPTKFRFCRNDQCDLSVNLDDSGAEEMFSIDGENLNIQISKWSNWNSLSETNIDLDNNISDRENNFLTGIEFSSQFDPSYMNRNKYVTEELSKSSVNWIVLTPIWNVNELITSPHLEPIAGKSPLIHDLYEIIDNAHESGMKVALFPHLDFGMDNYEWWHDTKKDALWWQEWFVEYERFLDNYAKLANNSGVDTLIVGGGFIEYSLPGGILTTNELVGTPSNADALWRIIISNLKVHYSGNLMWALPYSEVKSNIPSFIDYIDSIYILFDQNITDGSFLGDPFGYKVTSGEILDNEIFDIKSRLDKPIVIGLSYPSMTGSGQGCIIDVDSSCRKELLINPFDENASGAIALQEQAEIYNALCSEIMSRDWIDGIVSRGFFYPVKLQDKSSSIYGKPAMDVIEYWYSNIK